MLIVALPIIPVLIKEYILYSLGAGLIREFIADLLRPTQMGRGTLLCRTLGDETDWPVLGLAEEVAERVQN